MADGAAHAGDDDFVRCGVHEDQVVAFRTQIARATEGEVVPVRGVGPHGEHAVVGRCTGKAELVVQVDGAADDPVDRVRHVRLFGFPGPARRVAVGNLGHPHGDSPAPGQLAQFLPPVGRTGGIALRAVGQQTRQIGVVRSIRIDVIPERTDVTARLVVLDHGAQISERIPDRLFVAHQQANFGKPGLAQRPARVFDDGHHVGDAGALEFAIARCRLVPELQEFRLLARLLVPERDRRKRLRRHFFQVTRGISGLDCVEPGVAPSRIDVGVGHEVAKCARAEPLGQPQQGLSAAEVDGAGKTAFGVERPRFAVLDRWRSGAGVRTDIHGEGIESPPPLVVRHPVVGKHVQILGRAEAVQGLTQRRHVDGHGGRWAAGPRHCGGFPERPVCRR